MSDPFFEYILFSMSMPAPMPTNPSAIFSTLTQSAWQSAYSLRQQTPAPLVLPNIAGDSFLLLVSPPNNDLALWESIHDAAQVLRAEGGVLSIIERSTGGLWVAAARWAQVSACNIYINLDLLTIDPHSQDWGDFKIKPDQVEVQRMELTLKALFDESPALVVQVRKSELADVMRVLEAAQLSKHALTVGKPWALVEGETARLEVYRDAKKQFGMPVAELLS